MNDKFDIPEKKDYKGVSIIILPLEKQDIVMASTVDVMWEDEWVEDNDFN